MVLVIFLLFLPNRTQDFSTQLCYDNYWNKIYSGSHIIKNATTIKFLATFYDPVKAPVSGKIYLNGVAHDLTLELGNQSKSTSNISADNFSYGNVLL